MEALPDEGWVSIGDTALEYRRIGPPPPRALSFVLLHEGLGSVSTWGPFPGRLFERTGASVFAYSRPGYGATPRTEPNLPIDYIRRHALDVLPRMLDAIGFNRGFLVGHSDGASMAALYASTIADARLCGLVLLAPHFCVEPETLAEIKNARKAFQSGALRRRLARHHRDVDTAFWGWNNVWLDPKFAAFDLGGELAKIRVPTLLIRGDNDRYGTHRQVRIAEEICRCAVTTLLMPDCGHLPHREKLAETVDAIGRFCDGILPRGGDGPAKRGA